ncbi:MAG: hypothetical protein HC913_11160 [Microscillaceae bacterium]|nr:hypothetical protein [Microscillaceae bacterium]
MKIYTSPFQEVHYYAPLRIVEVIWQEESYRMTDEEYQTEMHNYLSAIEAHQPLGALPDTTHLRFTIHPDLQTWMNEQIFPKFILLGLQAAAFLVSKDIFAQISIEQTMEEAEGSFFKTRYFDQRAEALAWLEEALLPEKC